MNCRHRDFQSRALPAELSRPAGPAGRPRPSASEKVPRVASSRKKGRPGEALRRGASAGPDPRLRPGAAAHPRALPPIPATAPRPGHRRPSRALPPAVVAPCMAHGEAAPEARPRCGCRSPGACLDASRCMERLNTGPRARGDRPTGAGAFRSAESMHAANTGRPWQRTVGSRAGRLGWRHGAPLRAGPVPWQRTVGNGAVARHAPGPSHHWLGHQARSGRPAGARSVEPGKFPRVGRSERRLPAQRPEPVDPVDDRRMG